MITNKYEVSSEICIYPKITYTYKIEVLQGNLAHKVALDVVASLTHNNRYTYKYTFHSHQIEALKVVA